MGIPEITDFVQYDGDGNPAWTPSEQLTPQQRSAVKKFTVKERIKIDRDGNQIVERDVTLTLKPQAELRKLFS